MTVNQNFHQETKAAFSLGLIAQLKAIVLDCTLEEPQIEADSQTSPIHKPLR